MHDINTKHDIFIKNYALTELEQKTIENLYELNEIILFLPKNPTTSQVQSFKKILGVQIGSGYLDYQKSNNTFELIMQWREIEGIFE